MSVHYPPQLPVGPSRPPGPPMQGRWIGAGIGVAILAHLLTIVPAFVVLAGQDTGVNSIGTVLMIILIAQAVVFVGCMAGGIALLSLRRGNQGLGLGLILGWALGVLVIPVVGFGLCVQAIS